MTIRRPDPIYLPIAPEVRVVLAAARRRVLLEEGRNTLDALDLVRACAESAAGLEALYQVGCDNDRLRAEVDARADGGSGEREVDGPGPLYSEGARAVMDAARRLGGGRAADGVGLEDLVGALCSADAGTAALLASCGVRAARRGVAGAALPDWLRLAGTGPARKADMVAAVEEAVARGELAEGERLPSVRDLARRTGAAAGTVAAAYRELARRGLVITDGARGTTVTRPRSRSGDASETLERAARAAVIAAFRSGASAAELRSAIEQALSNVQLE